jgi:hypothetical protein
VVQVEAEQLARRAQLRLRGVFNGADPSIPQTLVKTREAGLAEIAEIASPIDRLRSCIELAEQLAPALPAGCAEHALPVGEWWRGRLADLAPAGRGC